MNNKDWKTETYDGYWWLKTYISRQEELEPFEFDYTPGKFYHYFHLSREYPSYEKEEYHCRTIAIHPHSGVQVHYENYIV